MAAKKAVKKKVKKISKKGRTTIAEFVKGNKLLTELPFKPAPKRRGRKDLEVSGPATINLDELSQRAIDVEMDQIAERARRDEALRHDNVMTQAQEVIYGEREKTYGRPEVNLQTIADFWTVYLKRKQVVQGDGLHITKDDVCQMMVFMKSGRLLNEPGHHDSQVDQIGYIGLQERVRGR